MVEPLKYFVLLGWSATCFAVGRFWKSLALRRACQSTPQRLSPSQSCGKMAPWWRGYAAMFAAACSSIVYELAQCSLSIHVNVDLRGQDLLDQSVLEAPSLKKSFLTDWTTVKESESSTDLRLRLGPQRWEPLECPVDRITRSINTSFMTLAWRILAQLSSMPSERGPMGTPSLARANAKRACEKKALLRFLYHLFSQVSCCSTWCLHMFAVFLFIFAYFPEHPELGLWAIGCPLSVLCCN